MLEQEGLSLTTEGKKTINKINFLAKTAPSLANAIIREISEDALKESDKIVNVKTSNLKSTGRTEHYKTESKIVYGGIRGGSLKNKNVRGGFKKVFVDYAIHVHNGTRRFAGSFFLDKGVIRALNKTRSIGKIALDNWVSKIKGK